MLGGVLAVDQVSQFAGDPSEAEQNGVRGKGFYNDSDESKVLGYPFISAATSNKSCHKRGPFFQQNCYVKACNELHPPKNSVHVNTVHPDLWDGDPALCPPDVTALITDDIALQHFVVLKSFINK